MERGNLSNYGFLHILVAQAYVSNDDPTNKIQVDHIDKNRSNNHAYNLRWVTNQQNSEHACGKRVLQCDAINGTVLNEFASIHKAAMTLGVSDTTIKYYIHRNIQTTDGSITSTWKYADGKPTRKRKRTEG